MAQIASSNASIAQTVLPGDATAQKCKPQYRG